MTLAARCLALLVLLAASAPTLGAQETRLPRLTGAEKLYGLSLIWKEADYNFPRFDQLPALDWDSAYQAFVPQVLDATTTVDYYRVLLRFVALLQDGHTQVQMPSWVLERHVFDQPHVRVEAVEGRAIVWAVADSLADRIPIGSEVVGVGGVPAPRHLEREVYPFIGGGSDDFRRSLATNGWFVNGVGLLWGRADSSLELGIRTPDGEDRAVTLTRGSSRQRASWVRAERNRPEGPFEFRWLEDEIAYVALHTFGDAAQAARFDSVAPELHRAAGVVIDLRRNGGGNDGIPRRITARHLATDTVWGARSRTRVNDAVRRAWGRYADQEWASEYGPYWTGEAYREIEPAPIAPETGVRKLDVPVAVLIGRHTGSAAEDFLVMLDGLENVILVGEPTSGSTGMSIRLDLPGGGSARILAKDDEYPDGREFLEVGVRPDVLVEPTVDDLLGRSDGMLERALEVVRAAIR